MADRKPRPGFRFPGPVPAEALEFFRAKKLRPSFSHLDVAAEEHALEFTVAKSTGFDILADVKQALDEHLAEGGTLRTFEKQLTPILQKKGWWGVEEVADPETGDKRLAQLGSPRRLKTIFRSNMRAARAAGQWQRIQRTKRTHPYLLYRLGPSEQHRARHVEWNGTLLPADDPWWNDHFPPNGWGCKCWLRQVSAAEAERLGGATPRPPRDEAGWANPRTGKTIKVDRGLDPAWASNPGRDRERILADRLTGSIDSLGAIGAIGAGEALAREAVRQIVDSPLLERQFAPLKAGQALGDLPVAFLPEKRARLIGAEAGPLALTRATAKKQAREHHRRNKKWPNSAPLSIDDYRTLLPEILERAKGEHVVASRDHWRSDRDELLFAYERDKLWYLLAIGRGRTDGAQPRLLTFYQLSERDALRKLAEARRRAGAGEPQ